MARFSTRSIKAQLIRQKTSQLWIDMQYGRTTSTGYGTISNATRKQTSIFSSVDDIYNKQTTDNERQTADVLNVNAGSNNINHSSLDRFNTSQTLPRKHYRN